MLVHLIPNFTCHSTWTKGWLPGKGGNTLSEDGKGGVSEGEISDMSGKAGSANTGNGGGGGGGPSKCLDRGFVVGRWE